jgi:hypothetical protein
LLLVAEVVELTTLVVVVREDYSPERLLFS